MTEFTKVELRSHAERPEHWCHACRQGGVISKLATFALAQMEQSEADQRELVERGKDIHTLTCALESERLRAENAEAENAKLRACVEAADDFVETVIAIETSQAMHRVYSVALAHGAPYNGMDWSKQLSTYRAARAEVDK